MAGASLGLYDNEKPHQLELELCLYVCCCNLGVLNVGVLETSALLFGVYIRAPDLWKLPHVEEFSCYRASLHRGALDAQAENFGKHAATQATCTPPTSCGSGEGPLIHGPAHSIAPACLDELPPNIKDVEPSKPCCETGHGVLWPRVRSYSAELLSS